MEAGAENPAVVDLTCSSPDTPAAEALAAPAAGGRKRRRPSSGSEVIDLTGSGPAADITDLTGSEPDTETAGPAGIGRPVAGRASLLVPVERLGTHHHHHPAAQNNTLHHRNNPNLRKTKADKSRAWANRHRAPVQQQQQQQQPAALQGEGGSDSQPLALQHYFLQNILAGASQTPTGPSWKENKLVERLVEFGIEPYGYEVPLGNGVCDCVGVDSKARLCVVEAKCMAQSKSQKGWQMRRKKVTEQASAYARFLAQEAMSDVAAYIFDDSEGLVNLEEFGTFRYVTIHWEIALLVPLDLPNTNPQTDDYLAITNKHMIKHPQGMCFAVPSSYQGPQQRPTHRFPRS